MTYIIDPFAVAGDQTAIPFPVQGDGSVSFDEGFGPDYSLQLVTYPAAKAVPRSGLNYLFNVITTEIQKYQQMGVPPFITTSDNGGTPFSYANGAFALHSGQIYQSLCSGNTDTPPSAKWQAVNINFSGTSTGSSGNAIQVNTSAPININFNGTQAEIIINHNNTGPTTVQVGTAAAVPVRVMSSSGLVALVGGELVTGMKALFLYDGTYAQLINPVIPAVLSGYVTFPQLQQQVGVYATDSSTTPNLITYTPTPAYISYDGSSTHGKIVGNCNITNTGGPANLNVSGLGNLGIKVQSYNGSARDPIAGELQAGFFYTFILYGSAGLAVLLDPTSLPMGYCARVGFVAATTQSIAASTIAAVKFDNVIIDTYGWWDPTNFWFLPTFPGRYELRGLVCSKGTTIAQYLILASGTNPTLVAFPGVSPNVLQVLAISATPLSGIADGSTTTFSMNWNNSSPGTSAILGDVDINYPANRTNYFEIQYLGPN